MDTFTRPDAKAIRAELNAALEAIAKKYNATAKVGNITFGDTLDAKVTFAKIAENEHGKFAMTKEAKEFLERAESFGLTKDVLNEKCNYLGDVYEVTGYNTRAKRYPITFTKNGNRMKCGISFMKTFVRAERPELFL